MQPLRVEKVVGPVWWRLRWALLSLIAFVPSIVAPGGNIGTRALVLRRLDGERLAVETRTLGELAAALLSARSALI